MREILHDRVFIVLERRADETKPFVGNIKIKEIHKRPKQIIEILA